MDGMRLAALGAHCEWAGSVVGVSILPGVKGDGRTTLRIFAVACEDATDILLGELFDVGAVGVHGVDIVVAIAARVECDAFAIFAPCGSVLITGVSGEPRGGSALG